MKIIRKILFAISSLMAFLTIAFGQPAIGILLGYITKQWMLYIGLAVSLILLDIYRHRYFVRQGYRMPNITYTKDKKMAKLYEEADLKTRLSSQEIDHIATYIEQACILPEYAEQLIAKLSKLK